MTAFCACGKPITHKGMCKVRYAKSVANKAAAAPVVGTMTEEAIARRLFGDLADDILLLRAKGHTVARFRDGFRVDRDVLTAEALSARAKALRERPTKSRSPAISSSAEQPASNAADVPTREDGRVGERDPDIAARLAHIEKRLDQLFAFVAEAVECRRHTLIEQAAGLEQLHASLRTA